MNCFICKKQMINAEVVDKYDPNWFYVITTTVAVTQKRPAVRSRVHRDLFVYKRPEKVESIMKCLTAIKDNLF